jgi:tetratricopeptide (TPR) repeat protein
VLKYFPKTLLSIFLAAGFSVSASAQIIPPEEAPLPEITIPDLDSVAPPESETADDKDKVKNLPDYSRLSAKEERSLRLDAIFERLAAAESEEKAELIAEEVWAIWLDSGSASVNFVLRRGTAAHKSGKKDLARRLYDQTLTLSPDYAEGWARSSRLALEEENLSRALTEAAQTLTLEPRHFYALWTMGNVFEKLGRNDEALEAYREASKLHPQLKAVKDRLAALESRLNGDVL